jgi:hypothetical protein
MILVPRLSFYSITGASRRQKTVLQLEISPVILCTGFCGLGLLARFVTDIYFPVISH